jgi:S-formylglutathione hydrolase FrmB
MFAALFSFLGGSVFRMIWGEVSSFVNKKQDHFYEIEKIKLQGELDSQSHLRMLENLKLQNELGIKTVEATSASAVSESEANAFNEAMKNAWNPTGIFFVDAWNGVIRPAAATIVLALWVGKLIAQNFRMMDYDMEISGVVLGFFFADRGLAKRGK